MNIHSRMVSLKRHAYNEYSSKYQEAATDEERVALREEYLEEIDNIEGGAEDAAEDAAELRREN